MFKGRGIQVADFLLITLIISGFCSRQYPANIPILPLFLSPVRTL